jgi:anti-sigma regulatory factor (Ser/Thr protein kinase)
MSDRTAWSHDINLDDQPISASQARSFVRRHLAGHGLAHLSDDVEVIVSELATNAIRHSQTPFTVSLQAFERTLLLEVEDGSSAWRARVAPAHVLDTHGRGLAIVDLLCRDWGMAPLPDGGKSVWAEFTLPEQCSLRGRGVA